MVARTLRRAELFKHLIHLNQVSLQSIREITIFYSWEMLSLYSYTKGLPRDAIKVCFELLIELVAQSKKKATAKQVEEIAKGQNLRI